VYTKEIQKIDRFTAKAVPNPFSYNFTLITESSNDSPVTLRILDALGKIVEERRNITANGLLHIGGRFRPGIYFAEVIQGKEKVVLRLIKQSNYQ
jgi:hypothetical protein